MLLWGMARKPTASSWWPMILTMDVNGLLPKGTIGSRVPSRYSFPGHPTYGGDFMCMSPSSLSPMGEDSFRILYVWAGCESEPSFLTFGLINVFYSHTWSSGD